VVEQKLFGIRGAGRIFCYQRPIIGTVFQQSIMGILLMTSEPVNIHRNRSRFREIAAYPRFVA
jgi:hypothetical protein